MNSWKVRTIYLMVVVLLLVGCTEYVPVPVQVNHTIYRDNTTVIQNHTIEYRNATAADCECNVTNTSTKYILGLIQQIKRCEDNIVRHWNLTQCSWQVESMNRSLASCNDSLEEIRELLD